MQGTQKAPSTANLQLFCRVGGKMGYKPGTRDDSAILGAQLGSTPVSNRPMQRRVWRQAVLIR